MDMLVGDVAFPGVRDILLKILETCEILLQGYHLRSWSLQSVCLGDFKRLSRILESLVQDIENFNFFHIVYIGKSTLAFRYGVDKLVGLFHDEGDAFLQWFQRRGGIC